MQHYYNSLCVLTFNLLLVITGSVQINCNVHSIDICTNVGITSILACVLCHVVLYISTITYRSAAGNAKIKISECRI